MKLILTFLLCLTGLFGQTPVPADTSTNNDLFFMLGSDFDRPSLLPRANYNVGLGHTFGFLTKYKVGDEVTVSYTYENGGSHGFFHTAPGSNTSTESLGLMKNFSVAHVNSKKVTFYSWPQIGLTSITNKPVQNRLYVGYGLGAIVHLPHNTSIWIQESYNKVVSVPWYSTTLIGYTLSF